jgi:hypothetical protein
VTPWFERDQVVLTPDGTRYVAAAEGQKVSRPFHYRWLLPAVLGPWPKKWIVLTDACALLLPFLAFWYAGGGWAGVFLAGLTVGLVGVIKFNRRYPVLVDLPAMTVALASAACWRTGWYLPALALAVVAACIKETSPVFIAAWAWSPWPLVGLIAPAVRHFVRRSEEAVDAQNEWHLREVVVSAFGYRKDWQRWVYVLPWSACLVGLAHTSPQLAVVLALAYGQLVIATDAVRLYQWAFPVLGLAAAQAVDPFWYPVLLALHLVNPFASEGG